MEIATTYLEHSIVELFAADNKKELNDLCESVNEMLKWKLQQLDETSLKSVVVEAVRKSQREIYEKTHADGKTCSCLPYYGLSLYEAAAIHRLMGKTINSKTLVQRCYHIYGRKRSTAYIPLNELAAVFNRGSNLYYLGEDGTISTTL